MQNFKEFDTVRILNTNSIDDWKIAGRTGTIMCLNEKNPETESLNTYLVDVDGNDELAGEYELAEYEMELVEEG